MLFYSAVNPFHKVSPKKLSQLIFSYSAHFHLKNMNVSVLTKICLFLFQRCSRLVVAFKLLGLELMLLGLILSYNPFINSATHWLTPATAKLFEVRPEIPRLCPDKKQKFHRIVAQLLYILKEARPDLAPAVPFLTTRECDPNDDAWLKLRHVV